MSERNYAVGRGKPPHHARFKKGQSGNPAGRPKRSRTLLHDLEAELLAEVTVKENGKAVRLSKGQVLIKSMLARAVGGDAKSAMALIGLIMKLTSVPAIDISATGLVQVAAPSGGQEAAAAGGEADEAELPPDDDAILADYIGRLRAGGTYD
jgi:hypothetical protein